MSDLLNGVSNNGTIASQSARQNANNANEAQKVDKTKTKNGLLIEENNKDVKVQDFLNLMIAQLKNQDFMKPMDDTQYVTQLAQFSTMQQMKDLAYNSKANFMSSLVGKEVTAAKLSLGGEVNRTTGIVNKLTLVDGKFNFNIEGSDKTFTYEQIMEIKAPKEIKPEVKSDDNNKKNNNPIENPTTNE